MTSPDTELCKKFLKREHSKVWHPARTKALAAGSSDDVARSTAKKAAADRVQELRKWFDEGKINNLGKYIGAASGDVN